MLGSMVYGLEGMMDALMGFLGWLMLIGIITVGVVAIACIIGVFLMVTGMGEYFTGRF